MLLFAPHHDPTPPPWPTLELLERASDLLGHADKLFKLVLAERNAALPGRHDTVLVVPFANVHNGRFA